MQTEIKSRPPACLPQDHAATRHICEGEETSESGHNTWRAAQEKREAVAQHLLLRTKHALLQVPQRHWESHDPVTCPLSLTPPAAWGPASGSHRTRSTFFSRQGKAPFCPAWMGGVRAGTAHLVLLASSCSRGYIMATPASNQAPLRSLASLLVFPAKTSPQQGLAVASLPAPEETYWKTLIQCLPKFLAA